MAHTKNILNIRWLQYIATISVSLSMFTTGMHFVWTSPSLPKLYANDSHIKINLEQGSWIASIELLADIPGAPIGAILADCLGRKISILLTSIPYVSSWLLIAFGKDIKTLLLAKFIVGLADGCTYTILPMYVGEIADDDIRGILGNCMTIMFDSGSFFVYSVAPWISIQSMALIGTIFPILLFILVIFMPETPYYLLMKEKFPEAKRSLKRLRKNSVNIETEFEEMKKVVEVQTQQTSYWSDLYTNPGYFRAMLMLMGLKTLQQMSGIHAIMVYSEIIFEEADGIFSGAVSSIMFGAFQLLSGLGGLLLIDKIGRRPLLLCSCVGCIVALTTQSFYFYLQHQGVIDMTIISWVPISSMIVYITAYSFGLGPIPFTIVGEMFPTNIKAKALCVIDIFLGLIEFIIVKNYQLIANQLGNHYPFLIFAMSCVLGIVFIIFIVPETKGCSLENVQNILKNEHFARRVTTQTLQTTKF